MSASALEGRTSPTASLTPIGGPGIGLVESKLRPTRSRPGDVVRATLLDRLDASVAPIVSVVAPAGYGKSTLLGQWVARCPLPWTWLSLDRYDNEPGGLLEHLLAALERIEPIDPDHRASLLAEVAVDSSWALRRLAVLVSSMRSPYLLVLDHVEKVDDERCRDLIAAVALDLPEGSRLALASRAEPPIPTARLRASGLLDEIGRDDLTMDEPEAAALLSGAGTPLEATDMKELVALTEGWPVGLYLASLSMKASGSTTGLPAVVHGDNRLLADYLRAEVLSGLPTTTVTLLVRTSILDSFSGPLCDAVMASSGGQDVLESLEESNRLLVPLDNQRRWYRCHHLLAELLRAELERTEPDVVPRLHDRAATWFEANGQPAAALDHAQAAGDADRAARLFGRIGAAVHGAGRVDTVLGWLAWFDDRGLTGRYPQVAVIGALIEALRGAQAHAHVLADAAASGDPAGLADDGSRIDGWVAAADTCLCRHGVARMREDATRAIEQLSMHSPLRGPATALGGLAALLQGDLAEADSLMAAAVEHCLRSGNFPGAAAAEAERAVIAIDRGDKVAAAALADTALAIVEKGHIEAYVHSTVVYAVAARTAALAGDMHKAQSHVVAAARLRPRCTAAVPWTAQFLVQLAHAYLALGDPRGARAVLRQVDDIMRVCPDLGTLPEQCTEIGRMLDTISAGSVGASSLTVAELRLLPLLATHLTYREIGERLHLSRNTIKSEVVAILRKLGVSSRGQAVDTAERIGLLGR